MPLSVLLLLCGACALWDSAPYAQNVARLTDADGDGVSPGDGDCNDADPDINPYASDTCDSLDNDCDGAIDEEVPDVVWCQDVDGDRFGDVTHQERTCFPAVGWVQDCTDCDDAMRTVNPDAAEICNGVDDDCDGITDPATSLDAATWYPDEDGDGYGSAASSVASCVQPTASSEDNTDCDDSEERANPSLPETCNDGIDNNCDGEADGCGWWGESALDTRSASRISGPDADQEVMGLALAITDTSRDGVADIVFAGFGAMYGDPSMGDVHLWYGTPTGERSVYEAGGHLYGVRNAYVGVAEWGAPVATLDTDDDGVKELIIAGGGWSSEYGLSGALFAVPTPIYGEIQLSSANVWAAGMDDYEGFGAGFVLSDTIAASGPAVVVAAPENARRGDYSGAVYVLSPAEPQAATAEARILGEEGDRLGLDVCGNADVSGDGVDDLVAGSAGHEPPTVFLFEGPLVGDRMEADADTELRDTDFGAEGVFVIPDFDGDGVDDLAIQSFRSLNLVPGTQAGEIADVRTAYLESGRQQQTSIGMAMTTGDIGPDGDMDLALGLPEADTPAKFGAVEGGGAVAIIPYSALGAGSNDAWEVADATFYGVTKQGFFGARLALGDVNVDGHLDLLASAAEGSEAGFHANGAVWFILGGGI